MCAVVAQCNGSYLETKLKLLMPLAVLLSLVGCADSQTLKIHNPEIYATQQTAVDNDGVSLALPTAKHWSEGTGRMID